MEPELTFEIFDGHIDGVFVDVLLPDEPVLEPGDVHGYLHPEPDFIAPPLWGLLSDIDRLVRVVECFGVGWGDGRQASNRDGE